MAHASEAVFRHGSPLMIDWTPAADANGGTVVVQGEVTRVVHTDFEFDAARATRKHAVAACGGVYECIADGAIAAGVLVYWNDAAKKVTVTAGANKKFGVTASAAAGDGEIIMVEHNPGATTVP